MIGTFSIVLVMVALWAGNRVLKSLDIPRE
jgi:hypothetical protein